MKIEDVYERFLIKVEKNSTNDGSSTERGKFVIIFNEEQNKFIELALQNRGIDDIRYIESMLILDKSIKKYTIPEDEIFIKRLRLKPKELREYKKGNDVYFQYDRFLEIIDNYKNN